MNRCCKHRWSRSLLAMSHFHLLPSFTPLIATSSDDRHSSRQLDWCIVSFLSALAGISIPPSPFPPVTQLIPIADVAPHVGVPTRHPQTTSRTPHNHARDNNHSMSQIAYWLPRSSCSTRRSDFGLTKILSLLFSSGNIVSLRLPIWLWMASSQRPDDVIVLRTQTGSLFVTGESDDRPSGLQYDSMTWLPPLVIVRCFHTSSSWLFYEYETIKMEDWTQRASKTQSAVGRSYNIIGLVSMLWGGVATSAWRPACSSHLSASTSPLPANSTSSWPEQ